ncbi:MAG: ATP-binding cassette domain-containing protein [Ruthenibacterium sp.]
MLLQASGIQKYFGAELCLADISFSVNEQDRIGIIGQNGAGKTTLLKLITGEYEPDAGELSFARGVRVGYLEQNAALHPQRTVYQEMGRICPVLAAMQELQQVQAKWRRGSPHWHSATASFRP